MAFEGPHHISKMLGKNHQSTTKVTRKEPPISKHLKKRYERPHTRKLKNPISYTIMQPLLQKLIQFLYLLNV